MKKADYIRQMTDEQLRDTILDCEEQMLIASCKSKYCPYYEKNGGCSVKKHNLTIEQGCSVAIINWLNSEVSDGENWYE